MNEHCNYTADPDRLGFAVDKSDVLVNMVADGVENCSQEMFSALVLELMTRRNECERILEEIIVYIAEINRLNKEISQLTKVRLDDEARGLLPHRVLVAARIENQERLIIGAREDERKKCDDEMSCLRALVARGDRIERASAIISFSDGDGPSEADVAELLAAFAVPKVLPDRQERTVTK